MTHLGPYELDRVYLGDCIELMKELPDECYVISDPPYNQKYHYGFYGDNLQDSQYYELLFNVFYDRKAVIIHYPEETINLMGGGQLWDVPRVCIVGLQQQHGETASPYNLVELQA